ncbi:MAG: hypothetical protein PHR30_02070 [Gallionellaceae bacterium]|nr:hypothetical protein [Gallionellaceae bacterium]MDD5364101.1 hypothetical protein [Gallionellaceae bacterium]
MLSGLARALRACAGPLRDPAFWWLLLGITLVALLLGGLIVFAVERHDDYLRLRPLVCEGGIADRKFFLVAVAAPPWLMFVLATLGELWGQLEQWREGRATRWFHFWLFLALASGLGALVLFGLAC